MRDNEIVELLTDHPGTRILEANGDRFAIHDPDGDLPPERQMPWATVVTSDLYTPDGQPWDVASRLDRPGVFRLSLGLPRAALRELTLSDAAPDTLDVLLPHPDYAGWVIVGEPDHVLAVGGRVAGGGTRVRRPDVRARPPVASPPWPPRTSSS